MANPIKSENNEYIQALEESDKWIEQLYLEKIKEVDEAMMNTVIDDDTMIQLSEQTQHDLCCLLEELKLTIHLYQEAIKATGRVSFAEPSYFRFFWLFMSKKIKGELPLWMD